MFTDTLIIFQRDMRGLLRNPVWLFFGLTQPILFIALFGPLLTNVAGGGLGGDASWNIFVPGIILQLAIFGAGFAGFGIIQELREGVVDRQRVTPARRSSLIFGRVLANTVTIGVQAVILTLVAIPFGLRPSWIGVVLTIVLVCVISSGMAAASYSMGLILKEEDSFAPMVQGISLPLLLLSGVFLPMTLAPDWLRIADQSALLRGRRCAKSLRRQFRRPRRAVGRRCRRDPRIGTVVLGDTAVPAQQFLRPDA